MAISIKWSCARMHLDVLSSAARKRKGGRSPLDFISTRPELEAVIEYSGGFPSVALLEGRVAPVIAVPGAFIHRIDDVA